MAISLINGLLLANLEPFRLLGLQVLLTIISLRTF